MEALGASTKRNVGSGCVSSCVQHSRILLISLEPQYSYNILADRIINSTLWTIIRCLKLTPIHYLPTIAGIPPASLRRDAASLRLAKRYQDENHHLHYLLHQASSRLTARWPFNRSLALLNSTIKPDESTSSWLERTWTGELSSKDSLPEVPDPQAECLKIDLSRAWATLNRLRTGTGRFRATLYRWNMANDPLCPYGLGEEQSANHILQERCLLHRFPGTA